MAILNKDYADPPELRQQMEKAMNGLATVTAAHQGTWNIDKAAWSVDQEAGIIVFTTPRGMRAEAPVQIIGTYNTEDRTWLWGSDHPSVLPVLAEHARQMLRYGQEHGFARLTTLTFAGSEQTCSELTALAFLLCRANGAYRGSAGAARVFMTFGEIKLSRITEAPQVHIHLRLTDITDMTALQDLAIVSDSEIINTWRAKKTCFLCIRHRAGRALEEGRCSL